MIALTSSFLGIKCIGQSYRIAICYVPIPCSPCSLLDEVHGVRREAKTQLVIYFSIWTSWCADHICQFPTQWKVI